MKVFLSSLLMALILLTTTTSQALLVRSYTPAKYNRFYTGIDENFVGDPYDFSGVGYSSGGQWATLVSDNYFISATHLSPGIGQTVTFYATNSTSGPSYTYRVTGGVQIAGTDLWLGWFDSSVTVDKSIARYPVEMLPTYNDYIGATLYNYGKDQVSHTTAVVGRNVLDKFSIATNVSTGIVAYYDYDNNDTPSVDGDETLLQGGDSGAPSFMVFNSKLAVIGIHWLVIGSGSNGSASMDTFVPSYYNQVNAVMATRGQSLMAVPEPNGLWYFMISVGLLWILKRHRTSP